MVKHKKASEYQREKRKEVARLSAIANKRIKRLEAKGMDTPALNKLGSKRHFGLGRGKNSQAEINNEYIRVHDFLGAMTSTVTGATQYLDNLANIIGYEGVSNKELQSYAKTFFSIVEEVKQKLGAEEQRIYSSTRLFNAVSQQLKMLGDSIDSTLPLEDSINSILSNLRNVDRVNNGYEGFTSAFDDDDWDWIKK